METTSPWPFFKARSTGRVPSPTSASTEAPIPTRTRTTRACPRRAAMCRGVSPSSTRASAAAPFSSRARATSERSDLAATKRGVWPIRSRAFMAADWLSRACTTSKWPFCAATCSGVSLLGSFVALTLARRSISARTKSELPAAAPWCKNVVLWKIATMPSESSWNGVSGWKSPEDVIACNSLTEQLFTANITGVCLV